MSCKKTLKFAFVCAAVLGCIALFGCGSSSSSSYSSAAPYVGSVDYDLTIPTVASVELISEEESDETNEGDLVLTWTVTVEEESGVDGYELRFRRYDRAWRQVDSETTELTFVTYSKDMNAKFKVRTYTYDGDEIVYSDWTDVEYLSYTTYDDEDSWVYERRTY